MKLRCQDGSIDVTPDFTDDVVSLIVRNDTCRDVSVTLSRSKAQQLADALHDIEAELAEYDK